VLVAAAVVIALGSVIFARHMSEGRKPINRVAVVPTPNGNDRNRSTSTPRPRETFTASGTWTMSSLPECFDELSKQTGLLKDLRGSIPPENLRVASGTVLQRNNCTLTVRPHEILITRGIDRVRVPPEARLYRSGDRLTLVAITGPRMQIRRY